MKIKIHSNFQNAVKALIRGQLLALNAYIWEAKSQINNLNLHLKNIRLNSKLNPKL